MLSDKFRQQLRQEAEKWLQEGFINPIQYEQLAQRYRFDSLETYSFTVILIGLGGILLGLGVITFVAANWQIMSRELRAGLLIATLVGTNWLGFHLWQRSRRWQNLGKSLLILGAMVLGANIALVSQMFHLSGALYGLFFVWGFGVLAMAYGLRFTPLGVIGIILIGLGYWNHFLDYYKYTSDSSPVITLIAEQMLAIVAFLFVPLAYWCRSRTIGILAIVLTGAIHLNHVTNPALSANNFLLWLIVEYMPIISATLFLPLAYYCRSRSVFMFSIALILGGLSRSIIALTNLGLPTYLAIATLLTLPPALLWAYDDALYFSFRSLNLQQLRQAFNRSPEITVESDVNQAVAIDNSLIDDSATSLDSNINYRNAVHLESIAHGIALIFLSLVCYFQSFYGAWQWQAQDISFSNAERWSAATSFANAFLFTSVAILSWYKLLVLPKFSNRAERSLTSIAIGCLIVIIAGAVIWHAAISPIPEIATFLYNVVLFFIAIGLIRESLEKSKRLSFWSGISLLALQIISRVFEYDTDLLLKSFIFALCGIGVIIAGLWFERYLRLSTLSSKPEIVNTAENNRE